MCGIIGVLKDTTATFRVQDKILDGLKKLEYRGYDSSGIVVLHHKGCPKQSTSHFDIRKAVGKIAALETSTTEAPLEDGCIGLGHTRWATHGKVDHANAHPHGDNNVALVHNGIVENFSEYRQLLIQDGVHFKSATDTEVVAHLLEKYLNEGLSPLESVLKIQRQLTGAFALGIIFKNSPHQLFAARRGSPLVIGLGDDALYIASDPTAIPSQKIVYLEDGDVAVLTQNKDNQPHCVTVYDAHGAEKDYVISVLQETQQISSKGTYQHFMLKEIFEQPISLQRALSGALSGKQTLLPENVVHDIERIRIIACGTSFYAGMVAQYLLEQLAGIPVTVDIASEFRYRSPVFSKNEYGLVISQSGETIDTLEALWLMKKHGLQVIAMVNVENSIIAREAHYVIPLLAGPERGVASTKAFTHQILMLSLLALEISRKKFQEEDVNNIQILKNLPQKMGNLLEAISDQSPNQNTFNIQLWVNILTKARNVLYIGRGIGFPLALEGALKLKEITYIHASAYAAGELKHGPIALVDEDTPTIAIAPQNMWFSKTLFNIQEIVARGGHVLCLTCKDGQQEILNNIQDHHLLHFLIMPRTNLIEDALLYAIPLQMLAYFVGTQLKRDVDQPRNLAKSVTVE